MKWVLFLAKTRKDNSHPTVYTGGVQGQGFTWSHSNLAQQMAGSHSQRAEKPDSGADAQDSLPKENAQVLFRNSALQNSP